MNNPYKPVYVSYSAVGARWQLELSVGPRVWIVDTFDTEAEVRHAEVMLNDACAATFDPLDPDDC